MYRVSFLQIHYFLTIADVLSFTKAAELLSISQPALSKQINVLEKELGISLFTRNKRSVVLTPGGEYLYKEWSTMQNTMNSSITNAKILNHNSKGMINVGWTETIVADELLLELIDKYKKDYPNITINLESYSFKALRDKLDCCELDVVFIPLFELASYIDVEWVHFQDIQLSIAVPTSNPLSNLVDVTIKDLKDQPFVAVSSSETPHGIERIKMTCRAYGFEPNVVKYVNNLNSLVLSLKNGDGVTICHCSPKIFDNRIRLYDYHDGLNDSDIIAVWKKQNSNIELNYLKNELHHNKQLPMLP